MNSGDGSTNWSADAFLSTDWLEVELAEAGLTNGTALERVREQLDRARATVAGAPR